MAEHWFVACVQAQQEKSAKLKLEQKGFECYLPIYVPQWGVKPKMRPFLPGYLFVRTEHYFNAIITTPGIWTVLCSGDRPQAVADWVIDEMVEREQDGIIQLPPRPMSLKRWRELNSRFRRGDAVHVQGGPLDAVFEEMIDKTRAQIFFKLLGKLHTKMVPLAKLSLVQRAAG